jgi:hypothetical protein
MSFWFLNLPAGCELTPALSSVAVHGAKWLQSASSVSSFFLSVARAMHIFAEYL